MTPKDEGETRRFQRYQKRVSGRKVVLRPVEPPRLPAGQRDAEKLGGTILAILVVVALLTYLALALIGGRG